MAYNPIKWIIFLDNKPIILNQNPSEMGSSFDKGISYIDTIDGGVVRISPPTPTKENIDIQWSACNVYLRELLRRIAKEDRKVTIISHHGKNTVIEWGSTIENTYGLTAWEGYFDEYSEREKTNYQDIYYEISVKMLVMRELEKAEIISRLEQMQA